MELQDIVTRDVCFTDIQVNSKKRLLEEVARTLSTAYSSLDEVALFRALSGREALGSTGFGNGIAIPHCRLEGCKTPLAGVYRLAKPIDFDARDHKPVDLLFALIVPVEDPDVHLAILSGVVALYQSETVRDRLRNSHNSSELYENLMHSIDSQKATGQ
jgi:PTS system nitrogen regulatory IIA component